MTSSSSQQQQHLKIPVEYQGVVPALQALFTQAKAYQGGNAEVEGKLGVFKSGGNGGRRQFESGVVSQQFFNNQLLKMQSNSHCWSRIEDWTDTEDYIFDAVEGLRGTKTQDGSAFFIRKTTRQHVDIACPDRQHSLRVSFKTELPVPNPPVATPNWVRIKKRKSFIYKMWSFDFTYVWSGATLEQARAKTPTYEIEIECVDLNMGESDAAYLAVSLLGKLHDLLDRAQPCRFQLMPSI